MYLDVLWALNFGVDLLLLLATNRLAGYPTALGRLVPAAVIGGVYGCACILPGLYFLAGTVWRMVFLGIMGGVAFGFRKESIRRCVLFTLLSMALGGIALGLGRGGFFSVLFCAAMVCFMCLYGLRGRLGSKFLPVEVNCQGKRHRFTAMVDTGNTLTDPVTGQQVLVVSSCLAGSLLGLQEADLKDPVAAVTRIRGGRLIPYQGVGTPGGLLAAKRFEDVTIGKQRGGCLIAFAPQEFGKNGGYEALTGGVL